MNLTQRSEISCGNEVGGIAMENIQHCRAMGSLFRQFAVFDPVHSWKYLIEAQKWEHLADAEIASHFKECNARELEFRTPPVAERAGWATPLLRSRWCQF